MDDPRLVRLAQLTVRTGANVQPGQLVVVGGEVAHAALIREIARAAYRAGARKVSPFYIDPHFTRAAVELGPPEMLSDSDPWDLVLFRTLQRDHGAYIFLTGSAEPKLMADLPGELVARARPREVFDERMRMIGERTVNWTLVPAPTEGWAQEVFGKPDLKALWDLVEKALRLDRDDPVAAWRDHVERLKRTAHALNERSFDSLRYRGPGTDLTIGLLPSSRWHGAEEVTTFGVTHIANLPTEEVFTSPDKRRAEGTLRSTRPLHWMGRALVRDLALEFHDGRIVNVKAAEGADLVRGELATDEGSNRLGEVALVDGCSEVGKLGITFHSTLFDENATSHLAYGAGFEFCVDGAADRELGLNRSAVHTDFMVGGPEVDIDGLERGRTWVPILHDNEFQIG